MIKRVSTAEAEAHLAALLAEVVHEGGPVIIEKQGRPLAALVRPETLAGVGQPAVSPEGGRGALALIGAGNELTDDEIEAMVAEIYEHRDSDYSRPVTLPE